MLQHLRNLVQQRKELFRVVSDNEFSAGQSRALASNVREELARRRISRQTLADKAKISLSTLEKALSGRRPFTLATVIRLEEALGCTLRDTDSKPLPSSGEAPEHLGSYSRQAVSRLIGDYVTLRASFGDSRAIFAYRTEICWSDTAHCLIFREAERLDAAFNHQGFVSLSNHSGHIYLVTSTGGQYRLAVLGRPTMRGIMYGILSTLRSGRGTQLTPVAAALALVPAREIGCPVRFGRIAPGEPLFETYNTHLGTVTGEEFALFAPGTCASV